MLRAFTSMGEENPELVWLAPALLHNSDWRTVEKRQRRETVEHPFGTIKDRRGANHGLGKALLLVSTQPRPKV